MNKGTEKSFEMCRACLVFSNNTYQIFEDIPQLNISIATMLDNCSIEVRQNDGFPKAFCSNCLAELRTAYNFVQTYKKSQVLLDQCLIKSTGKIIVVDVNEISDICNTNSVERNDSEIPNSSLIPGATGSALDNAEDTTVVECDRSKEGGSYDSDDQDFLIAQSVKLTQRYKQHKLDEENDYSESDTEDEVKEQSPRGEEVNNENEDQEVVSADSGSIKFRYTYYSILSCPLCSKTFKKFSFFSSHIIRHNQNVTCDICVTEFDDIDLYLRHYKMKHRYWCRICQRGFPRGDTFSRHMQGHNNTLPKFDCPVENCSKTFTVKQSVINHYKTIHCEKRNFLCNLCGASFKNCDNLRYHLKKHKGPSHLCTYCGKTFMQSVHLKYHMWRHTGVKPYKCPNCVKSFVSKRLLIAHQKKNNCGRL